jgi:uracil-DNA glycosylase family 4
MTRCALCPGVNVCIPPDISDGADLLFIGEAPGKDENKKGRVFIGKTGDEVNRHYLPLAGLRRDSTGFANAISCLPTTTGGKLDPSRERDQALLSSCAETHLYPLIERGGFRALIPLGAFACKALGLDIQLETDHGFPVETSWSIPAFPMYHPALGIHEPKKMLYIRTDWMRLKRFLNGNLELPWDDYAGREDYREVTDVDEIRELEAGAFAADTENKRGGDPYCLTFSRHPGQGRLIRADRPDLIQALQRKIDGGDLWPILFHHWLHDRTITTKMGLHIPDRLVVDTLLRVFHLGNLPQGLKALAKRELGMVMQDFDDVVTPHSRENVLHYYNMAKTFNWPKPEERLEIDSKTGLFKLYKPQSMNTKLKRFFTDYGKNPEKDVFAMWTDNWVEDQAMIEEQCGPWPGKCISHAPFEDVLFYACRDADALIRLHPLLEYMESRVRLFSQEYWAT